MNVPAPAPTPSSTPKPAHPTFLQRLREEPNALWLREMRQAARIGRTPWALFTMTTMVSLLVCTIGGIAASEAVTPASLGSTLYQVFFSVAYMVVILAGPALAANGIAAEREGRTWEAVLLTGLTPKTIARGKFLAAYTVLALYLVVLSPAGAVAFLFGGVTATEVFLGYVFLFLASAPAVAFGLAVSSFMQSTRGAIVLTLVLAITIGPTLYSIFGVASSFAVHHVWRDVPEALPVWLPTAYARADFGLEYLLFLVALPLVLLIVPTWFLYESTIANLTSEHDDRTSGVKRWFVVSTPLVALAATVPAYFGDAETRSAGTLVSFSGLFGYLVFCAFLFAFEPPGPSRRVLGRWAKTKASGLRRALGPGIVRGHLLLLLLGIPSLAFVAAVAIVGVRLAPTSSSPGFEKLLYEILAFSSYAIAFFMFVCGAFAWVRAHRATAWSARLLDAALLFAVTAGPWIVAAIAGVLGDGGKKWLALSAPSPTFAVVMAVLIDSHEDTAPAMTRLGLGVAFVWGALGLVLLVRAGTKANATLRAHADAVSRAEAALRAEDEALAAQHAHRSS